MTDITVPELGESIIEGTLTAWLVKVPSIIDSPNSGTVISVIRLLVSF